MYRIERCPVWPRVIDAQIQRDSLSDVTGTHIYSVPLSVNSYILVT